jgi:ribonuclease-3
MSAGSLKILLKKLDCQFTDLELLDRALSHRSAGARNNERLEFLGDSILNHVIAHELYLRYPKSREGELSRMRASLVKGETLAQVARELKLGSHLRLGAGEMKSGGHRRNSILADTLEAIFGAVLLDLGEEACRRLILQLFESRLCDVAPGVRKDAKTRLQEHLQGRGKKLPEYELVAVVGEDHNQQFTVRCKLAGSDASSQGDGSSRRRAEQAAAASLLEQLNVED